MIRGRSIAVLRSEIIMLVTQGLDDLNKQAAVNLDSRTDYRKQQHMKHAIRS